MKSDVVQKLLLAKQLEAEALLMLLPPETEYLETDVADQYCRHNQELRKIRKFIRKKGPSCTF